MDTWFDSILPKLPGVIGSALACTWIQGTWRRKLALLVGGGTAAFYLGPWVAEMTGIQGEGVGFIAGLFSMDVADVVINAWR